MADQVVQVNPDSTGKKIETSELTRDDGIVVERQRFSLGDFEQINNFQVVSGERSRGAAEVTSRDLLHALNKISCQFDELIQLIKEVVSQ